MNEESFRTTQGFKSYVNKPEITALLPSFLVKGSKNVLIDYAQRVVSRNGFTLLGAAGPATATGIKGEYVWNTAAGIPKEIMLRSWGQQLEFLWNNTWNVLKTGLSSPDLQFAKILDLTEQRDVLLYVNGETNTYKWSGGMTKVWKSTATTLTKQGVITAQTTIAFVAGTPGTVAATIIDSANNFLNAGFASGDILNVTGSPFNSRNFTIGSVTAGTITLIMSEVIVSEAVGATITLHNGEPTWLNSRFLSSGTRKIVYQGVEYAYTGGESTDTLTGLSAFPTVTVGDSVWQAVVTLANPGAIPSTFKQDLIGVQTNQLVLASTKSLMVYGSSGIDYTNFTVTSPTRAPLSPFAIPLSGNCTCIIPIDGEPGSVETLLFGVGNNQFSRNYFKLSLDNSSELAYIVPLKTGSSLGVISKNAIVPIKSASAYITREPSLDILSHTANSDGSDSLPLSDPIKSDFDSYDFTNADVKYWKRALYIAVPNSGVVLIYDLIRKLWQPPQTIPVSRLSIYNDWIYGHSAVTNETYKLFVGTNDNGIFIPQVARFAYNNGGRRDRIKNMSEYWTDGYITQNGELDMTQNFGYDGSLGKRMMKIMGSDASITTRSSISSLGEEPLGSSPLGGSNVDPLSGLPAQAGVMLRFWQADTIDKIDYTEAFVEYAMNTLDGQFAIIAHGSNQYDVGTVGISHKK